MVKKSAGFTGIEIIVAIIVVSLVAITGYIILRQSKPQPQPAIHQIQAPSTPSATPQPTSTPSTASKPNVSTTPDAYAGWKSYSHPAGYFSFKYRADWSVQREVVNSKDNTDDVHIYAGTTEIAQLARYSDGVGSSSDGNCQPLFHDMPLGNTTLKLVGSTCGGWYSSGAKIKSLQSNTNNIVLAAVANNFIMVRAAYGQGFDAQLDQWGKSITGIVPPVGY